MKTIIHKILFIILLSAFIVHPLRAEEKIIIIEQITFTDEQTVTVGSGESTVSAEVTYTPPGIPYNAEYYIELINNEIQNQYDAQIYVQQITPTAITFVIPENTLTQGRTFIIRGNSSKSLIIEQEGAEEPEPEPDPGGDTPTDVKFNISGNWIIKRIYTNAAGTTWYDDITFYNGLGYPEQVIKIGASSKGKNMVTPIVYDAHMRADATAYLPYESSSSTLVKDQSALSAQQAYYTSMYSAADGARAFNSNIYEPSPLGRVNAQQKSGSAYSSKKITYTYSANAENEVLRLKVSFSTPGTVSTASLSVSYYPAASLYKTTATDEDGGVTIEYKNHKGNVVLQRSLISGSTYADTYYSYDPLGRLLWVVSPEGSTLLASGRTYSYSDELAKDYSYIYAYDGLGNLIEKRQPGRDEEHYVYDKGKRHVMYQDGNLKEKGLWIYTTYDNINRIVEKTLVSTTRNRSSLQQLYKDTLFYNKYENLSNPNIPANAQDISIVKVLYSGRYYGYTYNNLNTLPSELAFAATATVSQADLSSLNHAELKYERHLLLQEGNALQYKETAYHYNNLAQLLQTVTKYPNGNILRTSFKYDFLGNIVTKEETAGSVSKLTTYTYDNRGKLISESTKLNGSTAATVNYTYDDMERIAKRTYGNGVTETLKYNIQGWTTTQEAKKGSSNIYSQTLSYYSTSKSTTPLYSGNISEWTTQQASQQQETYGLQYDKQGRLISSSRHSGSSTSAHNSYTERGITYDRNGNIKTLQRYNSSLQDNYTSNYTGNRITSITGTNNGTAIASATYSYDNNGNATTDGLKNLQTTYNILNLPQMVSQNGTTKATYTWFADGSKYTALDNAGNGYCYIGSLIYNTSANTTTTLESTDFSQGRIALSGNTQTIHYHHKDHLGSVRTITNGNGSVIEQNAYYPFGGRHTFGQSYAQATNNRYKFNGKEEQTIGNLDLLDYGARMYDTKIGRWHVQDPLAEEIYAITPYRFSLNNPIYIVDYLGLSDYFNHQGDYLGSDNGDKDYIFIITEENWDKIQIIDKDGNIIVNEILGTELSKKFMDAEISKTAMLKVYDHYNFTKLPLIERIDTENASPGMSFSIRPNNLPDEDSPTIKIALEANRKGDIYNHYYNIYNSFVHEFTHYKDYLKLGKIAYYSLPRSVVEKKAIKVQYDHWTFKKTTPCFQKAIIYYWEKNR